MDEVGNIFQVGESGIWIARIKLDGRYMRLGFFPAKVDAETAYEAALMRYARDYASEE